MPVKDSINAENVLVMNMTIEQAKKCVEECRGVTTKKLACFRALTYLVTAIGLSAMNRAEICKEGATGFDLATLEINLLPERSIFDLLD